MPMNQMPPTARPMQNMANSSPGSSATAPPISSLISIFTGGTHPFGAPANPGDTTPPNSGGIRPQPPGIPQGIPGGIPSRPQWGGMPLGTPPWGARQIPNWIRGRQQQMPQLPGWAGYLRWLQMMGR